MSADEPTDGAGFDSERPRLVGLAYRMLGSLVDAEDVVQEAWLRWERTDRSTIEHLPGWLTTVTSRLAIDRLRAQRRRREDYVGPWLPEPVAGPWASADPTAEDPSSAVVRNESLETGFLVVLDTLGPVERVVFVLADVFAVPYSQIAAVVDRTPGACRQVASRARRKVAEGRAGRRPADDGLLTELVGAIASGRADAVVELLAPGVVLTSDGGARRHAARRPVVLPERVARLLVNLGARTTPDATLSIEQVNGAAALVIRSGAGPVVLSADREPAHGSIERAHGSIERVHLMMNPDKLAGMGRTVELS